jgi:cyclophilin family peptidyl-prolyl cis-trans isomerase
MRSLAAAGAPDATAAFLRIIRDPSANAVVRREAMSAFMAVARSAHVDLLLDLSVDPSADTRAGAARALARVDPDAFIASIATVDSDADWRVRAAQAEALGSLPDGRGLARLRAMLADEDARAIPAVLKALAAAKASDAAHIATERLKAADAIVRATAATVLADLQTVQSAHALVAAYEAAKADTPYVARAAILAALSRLDRQSSRSLLVDALGDRDWAVRVRAAALLREQGATVALDRMRPATAGKSVDDPDWQRIVAAPYAPRAYLETTSGTIELELAIADAPLTTQNFVALARKGFFDGLRIHRVVPDFVVQAGDPRGDGEGGPGYTIRDEINQRPYLRGTLGMALDWEDTGGSQFFITHSPQPHLDARYTVFGRVVTGMNVVDGLTQTDVIERVRIWDGVNEP